ncbi:MAG: Mut7-C RNAse domain-containing protein [Actinomycetota bacterium]
MRAVLRFYAELRDLLAPEHRSGTVTRTFDVPGSVKDVIEACGVPHTEVDLILANGESVDFSYRPADGDRISVYPVFEAFDISPVLRVRPQALRRVRFVLDGHLGRLAGFLRLLGFDSLCSNAWSDHELVAVSTEEHRILLTRDVGLLKHGSITHGYYVRSTDPRQQLIEIVRRFHLSDRITPFTRCMPCNGLLEPAGKDDIAHRLPLRTRDSFDDYWTCTVCERIYWRGSHHRQLIEIVDAARKAELGLLGERSGVLNDGVGEPSVDAGDPGWRLREWGSSGRGSR